MTGLAGATPYLEFGYVMGLGAAIANRLKIRLKFEPIIGSEIL